MNVFKFGGASIKDANGVKNLAAILNEYSKTYPVVVISAMGKTTNALEDVIDNYLYHTSALEASIQVVLDYHNTIISELFLDSEDSIFIAIASIINDLKMFLKTNASTDYNFVYDQIIGYGELLSTTIVSRYLNVLGIQNKWLDVRKYIHTDASYRRANVNWEQTVKDISTLQQHKIIYLTQGFLGANGNCTTTLGREGSDYTAAIFAYALNAKSVTIWKDVPGVLNADPRYFKDAQLLEQLSYSEAIELAFYGASVIHPKTLQPLHQKDITLFVKSFLNPLSKGTKINSDPGLVPAIPCYIVKKNQVLIQISSLDFSYIVEENISDIFNILHRFKMKVDLIQNSAISFSVCVEDVFNNLKHVLEHFSVTYNVTYIPKVTLYTVRHYNSNAINSITKNKNILLQQRTLDTLQIVTK
ncbi:aspartate kinase [Formosa sediminum]|uniref:Aspartokinase n=1 Tax=Formosa sediminum TaxID=2594004 RepID=A0A516GPP8_9FLAO|nr:aspartate kinase [Formosa sediminum]QDO93330.1 aspartate kinase [Formosa sediminum]